MFERASATSLIVLPPEGDGVRLNGPAAAIFELTRGGATADDIAAGLAAAFDEDVDEIGPFVIETLDSLRAAGLVHG